MTLSLFRNQFVARADCVWRRTLRSTATFHIDVLEPAADLSSLDAAPPEGAEVSSSRLLSVGYGDEVLYGQLLKKVSPLYPYASLQGFIMVRIHIDTTGSVESTEGSKADNQILKAPVLSALKDWKFRVSYQGDKPIPVDFTYLFSYSDDGVARVGNGD